MRWLALVWMIGCATDVRDVPWTYRFENPATRATATVLDARILAGGCRSTSVTHRTRFAPGGAAVRPPVLESGLFGFSMQALDASCAVVAEDCEERLLSGSDAASVMLVLADTGATPACSPARCVAGQCLEPDAGGPARDAGPAGCTGTRLDCNGDPRDGCEADTQIDPLNCGECMRRCPLPDHASAACVAGECSIGICEDGFGDCDEGLANGCEQRLDTDAHCAACRTPCALDHAIASCATGACVASACRPGFSECDGIPTNGCETEGPCVCRTGDTCEFECTFGCDVICEAGSICEVQCRALPCSARCGLDAQCTIACRPSGSTCATLCDLDACPLVCPDPCP